MSSTYTPICLSHDPALVIGPDLTYDEVNGFSPDALGEHQGCDIVIGRFSYPLLEVACLGQRLPTSRCRGHHSAPEWTDRTWLRLLAAAAQHPDIDQELLRPVTSTCWPIERLSRLRIELDLPAPAPKQAPADGEPQDLTDEQLLPWIVRHQLRALYGAGAVVFQHPRLRHPYPPCPACGARISDVTFPACPALIDSTLMGMSCGHVFRIRDDMVYRLDETARHLAEEQLNRTPDSPETAGS